MNILDPDFNEKIKDVLDVLDVGRVIKQQKQGANSASQNNTMIFLLNEILKTLNDIKVRSMTHAELCDLLVEKGADEKKLKTLKKEDLLKKIKIKKG